LTGLSTNIETKIAAITSVKSDVIFLSDIRLTNPQGVKNDQRVTNGFKDSKNRSYDFFWNSTKCSRGVAILSGHSIDFEVISLSRDESENFLLMEVKIGTVTMVLGSIYGPNTADAGYFQKLSEDIAGILRGRDLPIILGGGLEYNLGQQLR